jgi:hypothetical protein
MSRQEAEALVQEKQGALCVGYYQRSDGTVLTQECPLGVRPRLWRGVALTAVLAFTLLAVHFIGLRPDPGLAARDRWRLRDREPFHTIFEWLDPTPPPPFLLGKMCPPPTMPSGKE